MNARERKAVERRLIGRRITAIDWNVFETENAGTRAGKWTQAPVFVLDDGSRVWFSTEETEIGEYGLRVAVHPVKRRA